MIGDGVLHVILILGAGSVLVYGVARLITRRNGVLAGVTAAIYALSLIMLLRLDGRVSRDGPVAWLADGSDAMVLLAEPGALLVALVALGLGFLVALYSGRYLALDHRYENYYPLLLLQSMGIVSMVMAADLFVLYLCTALTSAASYVLVAFRRRTETAIEAGFKYVVMSGMASILLLTGIGFVYRSVGSLQLPLERGIADIWGAIGVALILFGYLVKAAVFPAHTWLPDAHGRAPSSISAILSGIAVQAYMYVMIKTGLSLGMPLSRFGALVIGAAIISMIVGNVMAFRQTYGKRLLGYSTVAQLGYMMAILGLGLLYERPEPIAAGFFLVIAHATAKGLAFLCKGAFHFYYDATLLDDLNGVFYRAPAVTVCFILALAALAGLPPLVGFPAKLHILMSATQVGRMGSIVVIAAIVVNSLLSLGYYLPLIGRVLNRQGQGSTQIAISRWMQIPVLSLGGLIVLLGLLPGPLLQLSEQAAQFLLTWGR